uniref:BTB domain-containing protein n=1 Tax=Setaria italica TaxID=4555 RepID=K3YMN7_SETIT
MQPRTSRLEGRTIDSAFHEFRVDYEQNKNLGIGKAIYSDAFSAGSYMWRVQYYPHGCTKSHKSYVSIYIELFVLRTDLEKYYLTGGNITFVCAITVVHDRSIPVPPSDIKKHFSNLPGSTDVSFNIGVLKALMSSITLHDITPATFRVMLQFMYTDALPGDDELGDPPSEMMKQLLAAADRYGLDQLKLMCAQKLGDNVSVDTVAATLTCAEMYSCPELKNKCIDFFVNLTL